MAKGLSVNLSRGWNDYHLWSAAFTGKLRPASAAGTKLAMQFLLSEIDSRIRGGRYKKLSPLTAMIRQMEGFGDTPLVRRGGLLRSLTTDLVTPFHGNVGLLRKGKGKNGTDYSNIGVLLHDGGRIRITDQMRRAFMRRLGRLASKSGVSLLNRRGSKKSIIRIPPRPFIEDVFNDPVVIAKVELIYFKAVKEFMRL